MKILVTGGAGFIGSNLVKQLLKENHDIRVLDNLSTGYESNLRGFNIEFEKGDIRDKDLVEKMTKEVKWIFHLAASIGNSKSINYPLEDSEVNVMGTLSILEAARHNHVERVVYSSSAAIFGELLTMPIAEDHPQNPDSPYGVSKLSGEKLTLCYAKLYGFTAVCLRYFNVYGINQRYDAYGNVIPIFAHRLQTKSPLTIYGNGNQTRDFVNVKDVAKANILAAKLATKNGVYNVGSGTNITLNQLAQYVKEASGISTTIEYAPPRIGEVFHCKADISKLKTELGFEPDTDIFKGLKEYFDWFLMKNSQMNYIQEEI